MDMKMLILFLRYSFVRSNLLSITVKMNVDVNIFTLRGNNLWFTGRTCRIVLVSRPRNGIPPCYVVAYQKKYVGRHKYGEIGHTPMAAVHTAILEPSDICGFGSCYM